MKIQIFTPKNYQNNQGITKSNSTNPVGQSKLKQLNADTVSFSGALPKKGKSIFEDAIEQFYLSAETFFSNTSKRFHATLKKVCEKLKDDGFSYDEVYNQKHPIKSKESYIDKYSRQGYVQDIVRGTVYWPDQANISVFKKFLDAMRDEGYEIASIKVPSSSEPLKLVKVPDLEIRQDGVSEKDLEILGDFLKMAEISRPRSSTYADYQMRFINKSNGKKGHSKKFPMELIMLYGPQYSKAKELESKYVFNVTRAFDKLHINLNEEDSYAVSGKEIISGFKEILREDVSKPLFKNAYNADLNLCGETEQTVMISKTNVKKLNGYLAEMKKKLGLYYKEKLKQVDSFEYIINLIKNSGDYKNRADKSISNDEILAMRNHLLELLPEYEAEDLRVVDEVQAMLKDTVKIFGEK